MMAAYYLKKLVDPDDSTEIYWIVYEQGCFQNPDLVLNDYDMEQLFKTYQEQKK